MPQPLGRTWLAGAATASDGFCLSALVEVLTKLYDQLVHTSTNEVTGPSSAGTANR